MKQVHIGFIGAGSFISMNHLPTAAKSDFIRIRAISDLNPEVLAAHQERYAPDYVTEDYRRILDDPQIELVVIGTRQDTHAQLIIESLDAGKWVWCEKPMCETPEEEVAILESNRVDAILHQRGVSIQHNGAALILQALHERFFRGGALLVLLRGLNHQLVMTA